MRRKDRSTALLLSIFLGVWGIDRFYLGQVGLGVAKLFGAWIMCGLWWLVDLFLIMRAADRYNTGVVEKIAAMQAPALPMGPSDVYTGPR